MLHDKFIQIRLLELNSWRLNRKHCRSSRVQQWYIHEIQTVLTACNTSQRDIAHLLRPAHLQQLKNITQVYRLFARQFAFICNACRTRKQQIMINSLQWLYSKMQILHPILFFRDVKTLELQLRFAREVITYLQMEKMRSTFRGECTTLTQRPTCGKLDFTGINCTHCEAILSGTLSSRHLTCLRKSTRKQTFQPS